MNTVARINNILVRLENYVSRITAPNAVKGGSLSKIGYC